MALATKGRRSRRLRRAPTAQQIPTPRRPRRRRRWVLAALLLLAVVLWFAPAIVAHTPLLGWILARATSDINGTVAVESASLGWLSPVAARGVEIRDTDGNPVLQAPKLVGNKRLAALLLNRSRLGHFRLDEPTLSVVLRQDGSNVEDVLANYLAPSDEPSRLNVSLEVVDGRVSLTDAVRRQTWQIDQLELSLSRSADADETLKLTTSAKVADPQHPGRLAAELTVHRHDAADQAAAGDDLILESDSLPLAMFQPLIARFVPQTRLSGRLSAKIHARFNAETAAEADVEAELTGQDVVLSTPSLGEDQLRLSRLQLGCQIARQDDRLEVKQSSLDCDLGTASMRGTVELGDGPAESLLAMAARQTYQIEGRVELARLAQMLPSTLRIRRQAEITSGRVQLALSSSRSMQGAHPTMVWQGRLEASDLKAVHGGRELTWEKPVLLTLAAHDGPQGPVVESLKCESDFLKLHAAGTPQKLAASATFDLNRLAEQLGQFVDLSGISLGGDGWAQFNWIRSDDRKFETDLELQLRDLRLAADQRQPWKEESLALRLSAGGQTDLGTDTQLHAASLELNTTTDHVAAQLTQPVLDLRGGGSWPVKLQAEGQLQGLPARIARWLGVQRQMPSGAYALAAEATASTGSVTVSRSKLTVRQFRLLTPSLKIEEPLVELALAGNWDRQQRRLKTEPVSLTSNSLSVQASRAVLEIVEEERLRLAAALKYRGNLKRLRQWVADPKSRSKWQITGEISGTATLESPRLATRAGGQIDAQLSNLVVVLPSGKRLQEPTVHLAARGDYEHQAKLLRLERLDVSSGALAARTATTIARPDEQTDLRLSGEIQYDLEKLARYWQPYTGSDVKLTGRGTSPVSYRGPLELAKAQAEAGLRWQRANVHGFQVGPGELKATLAKGILQAAPMDLAASGGRLLLAPRVRLAPGPTELSLPPGPLAKQVQITPAMCASALQYIAPVLAEVTSAQGSFSIDLDGCRIPLDDPARGELAGRFTIHSVQVGPGPLVRELAVLLGRPAPAQLRRESVVAFRMVGGRVYHQGLELAFPELTIRTYGSVGLDKTLAVMAEMPVPPKWLGNNVLGAALQNQTVRLPIGGTLSKPQIDRREMERISRQFLRNATRNVIEDELNRQLDRLFAPPR